METNAPKAPFISPAEEAKARAFREKHFREHATGVEQQVKLLSEIARITSHALEKRPIPPSDLKRLEEIAIAVRDASSKAGHEEGSRHA